MPGLQLSNAPGLRPRRRSGGSVLFTVIFATIFLVAFVVIGGVVLYLSKTVDHGEARFDSETGKQKRDDASPPPKDARPATRIERNDSQP